MERILTLLLALFVVATLAACAPAQSGGKKMIKCPACGCDLDSSVDAINSK
jgi:hypothetical protein